MAHSDSYKTIENFFCETNRISALLPVDEPFIEPSPILSILRPYQLETVKWMVTRELQSTHIQLDDMEIDLPLGGILADEMGLGKTVEMLACILGHRRRTGNENLSETKPSLLENTAVESEENKSTLPISSEDESMLVDVPDAVLSTPIKVEENLSACFLESSRQRLEKRGNSDYSDSPILEKRPALSSIKVNRTMKKKIEDLLKEYFEKFQRFYKRKHLNEENSVSLMEISFKIIVLNRFYNFVKHTYSKQQTWGFLLTEFNVDDTKSIGYAILETEMRRKCIKEERWTENISNKDCLRIIVHIDEFLTGKMMTKFEKDFNNILAYSLYIAPGDDIPLSDRNDVRCKCGSDKAQGKKIMCPKCNTFQHFQCVGLDYKFEDFDNYTCPYCWIKKDTVESSATLIVIPSTLLMQWKHEIKKHAVNCNLKVCIYGGVKKDYVLPDTLAAFDIVIVSFETLRLELCYASEVVDKNTRSLRHSKRYLPFTSPLTCISWWRLCIDEAQMVETVNKVSEMMNHLKSTYRWAVTGTPIGKSLKDLCGLITFLGIEPFKTESYQYFPKLLAGEQNLLHTLFAYVMRRRTKNEVSKQLCLPDLKVNIKWLSFTPIEGYFYQYMHSVTENTFLQKLKSVKNLDQRLSEACRRTTESVLTPLLSLRQACVHPQAVNRKNYINLSKSMRMEELLEQMIKKTKTECEDILRLYIMNVNGAAGVKIYMSQFAEAVSMYRLVLSKMTEFEHLTIDNFQVIHAKHNLYETALKDESVLLAPDEQSIPEQVKNLEQKYIDRRLEPVIVLLQNVEKHSKEIENYLKDFHLSSFDWWEKMFNGLDFGEMKSRILAELEKVNITLDRINVLLSTAHRLSNALQYWLSEVEDKRLLTYSFLDQITKVTPISTLCKYAQECHLRQTTSKKTCSLCKMESTMTKYENLLFNGKKRAQKGANNDEDLNPLNWNISAYECILNAILSYAKTLLIGNNDIKRATDHLKVLNLLKREFKTVRATWTKQCDLVHGYDEVAMAKSRFDAVSGSTDKLNNQNPLFQSQFETYEAESVIAYSRLRSKNGSLHYLMNLRNHYSDQGVANDCCPVCQVSADERRAVMSCGHFTCCICMLTLMKHSTNDKRIQCPVCRTTALIENITYVYGGGNANPDLGDVRGNYSVKVIAVTAEVLSLKQDDPNVKILIFSTWDRVLDVIEEAFKLNEIKFQRFCQKQKSAVELFKENAEINALLIPLRSGSKGLNLTEASHIIFTEPVLHVADEKQAIGRIYRLGQSKNMVVHKFLIKSTIEQRLFEMNEQLQKYNAEGSELTFTHLKELFIATTNDIETKPT